ncbi:adenylate kinase, partial [Kappamyces sp. JEL0680]
MLKSENKLVKGDPGQCVKYQGRAYFMQDEETKAKFCSQPYYFVKSVQIPPPRIVLMGPTGSGKSAILEKLSTSWNVPLVSFAEYCFSNDFGSPERTMEIRQTLRQNGTLSPDAIKRILQQLFTKEPYASQGWLLDGFPTAKTDLEVALKQRFVPDAFVFLQIDSVYSAKRRLPFEREEMHRLEAERLVKISSYSDEKLNDPNDPLLQTLIRPDEKLFDELTAKIEQETMILTDYQSMLETWGSIPLFSVVASRCSRHVVAEIERLLAPFCKNRRNLLSSAQILEGKLAADLIELGVTEYSRFGKHCPVSLHECNKPLLKNFGSVPIMYDNKVYFAKNASKAQQFLANPTLYSTIPSPKPVLASTSCIVGNPKSGKTSLGKAIAVELDAVHLTVSSVLQTILDGSEITGLAESIRTTLRMGRSLDDQMLVDAIIAITNRIVAAGKG